MLLLSVGKHPTGMLDTGILSTPRFNVKKQPNITEYESLLFKKAYKEIPIAEDYTQLVKTH